MRLNLPLYIPKRLNCGPENSEFRDRFRPLKLRNMGKRVGDDEDYTLGSQAKDYSIEDELRRRAVLKIETGISLSPNTALSASRKI